MLAIDGEEPIWQGLPLLFGSRRNFQIEALFKWPRKGRKCPVKQPLDSPGKAHVTHNLDLIYRLEEGDFG